MFGVKYVCKYFSQWKLTLISLAFRPPFTAEIAPNGFRLSLSIALHPATCKKKPSSVFFTHQAIIKRWTARRPLECWKCDADDFDTFAVLWGQPFDAVFMWEGVVCSHERTHFVTFYCLLISHYPCWKIFTGYCIFTVRAIFRCKH